MKKILVCLMTAVVVLCMCSASTAEALMESPVTIDLTPLLRAAILLCAAIVVAYLLPWIKARTTVDQQRMLLSIVKTTVYAAEQLFGADHGAEKLEYVLERLQARGLKIDKQDLRDAIEAAVQQMQGSLILGDVVKTEPEQNGAN